MTEFDLALEFLQAYAQTAAHASQQGVPMHHRRDFFEFCDDRGIEPTCERNELVWDLAAVVNECMRLGEDVPDEAVDEDNGRLIPTESLTDGLERHGWRLDFLVKGVGD